MPPVVQEGGAALFQHVNKTWKTDEFWYGMKSRIGVNYFPKIMKSAFSKAGLKGDYTLRSVRAGVVQELVEMGMNDEGKLSLINPISSYLIVAVLRNFH